MPQHGFRIQSLSAFLCAGIVDPRAGNRKRVPRYIASTTHSPQRASIRHTSSLKEPPKARASRTIACPIADMEATAA